MSSEDKKHRSHLPMATPERTGFVAYDAKDPDSKFPPIEQLRPPKGAPNVLVILIDDAGFGSSSAFGGPCQTPSAEMLAAGGLKFNRFHTTALCSPTRQAMLTGRNHHSAGMGGVTEIATGAPGYNSVLPNSISPLARTLKLNGYSTAQFGKCHEVPVWETSPVGPFDAWPTGGGGFEYFYGFIGGEANQWYPTLYEGTTAVEPKKTPEEGYHLKEDMTDKAIAWVSQQKALVPDKPFFVYFAPGATHAPRDERDARTASLRLGSRPMDTDVSHVQIGTLASGEELWLSPEARARHVLLIGATGTGKTTLLRHLMLSDIYAGAGFALIDPHGDIATEIADSIPPELTGRAVYFDPADLSHPIGFNPVERVPIDQRPLRAAHIIATFEHRWRDSWGPRMSYILQNAVRLLLDAPGVTLLGLPRLLTDEAYRAQLLKSCADPVIRRYWEVEYESYDKRFETEAISPILNKIGAVLATPALRNIIGQPKSTIDIPALMDSRRMLIVNLSKGRLGEEPTHLLGAFLTTAIAQAAESRASIPEENRVPFTLYADEFQNFATESFASILSEARKYRLQLVVAHQFLGQLPEPLRQAVLGNVGTVLSFRIGAEDAPLIGKELGLHNAATLTDTGNFRAWVKTLYNGVPTDPHHVKMREPEPLRLGRLAAVKSRTATRFGRERAQVEGRIARFLQRA